MREERGKKMDGLMQEEEDEGEKSDLCLIDYNGGQYKEPAH